VYESIDLNIKGFNCLWMAWNGL